MNEVSQSKEANNLLGLDMDTLYSQRSYLLDSYITFTMRPSQEPSLHRVYPSLCQEAFTELPQEMCH